MLKLGNLDAKRDWGHAKDFVKGMWLMLQQDIPDDYVLATGEQYSVRDFVKVAFALVNIKIEFQGEGLHEKGVELSTGKVYVEVDERYFRPAEVDTLLGCPLKAEANLNWRAETPFISLVKEMVWEDTTEYRDFYAKN
jgi:GDPmannose 4,6-dehydratase